MAVISKTDIANLALSHLHDKAQVGNVETETSSQARAANLWYEPALRQALVDFNPGFANKRLALTEHAIDPPETWTFRYQVPADMLHPRRIQNPLGDDYPSIPFALEVATDDTRSILTNAEDAVLIYTRDVIDTTHFTPHFVMAISYLLAFYMAGPTTGKRSMKADLIRAYSDMVDRGGAAEANVTVAGTKGWADAPWMQTRGLAVNRNDGRDC